MMKKPTKRWVVCWVLVLMYAPYTWVFFISGPWSSLKLEWLKLWPVLPGVVSLFLSTPLLPESLRPARTMVALYSGAGVVTLLIFAIAAYTLIRAHRAFWPALAAFAALSAAFGCVAYAMYRA